MKFITTFSLLVIVALCAKAQNIGINYSGFTATGEFNSNIDRNPAGISFTYIHDLNEDVSPWSVGGELGVAMYTNKEYRTIDNSGNEVDVYEEDCFWTIHGLAQYQFVSTPLFILYGEGRLGVTTFFSERHSNDENADIGESFKVHGTAFNTGLGGGLRLNLSGIFRGDGQEYESIWLDVAMSANSGSRTSYRNASEDVVRLSDASYRSLTNYTHLRIGLNYRIGS